MAMRQCFVWRLSTPNLRIEWSESPDCRWVLSTEIVNQMRVLDVMVDAYVVHLFRSYSSLLFLRDELGNIHESPEVGFYCAAREQAAALGVLGAPRGDPNDHMGPYYHFIDVDQSLNRNKRHGGISCALCAILREKYYGGYIL